MRDYRDSRPVVAELEAIGRAILFAEETGCSLHVVHVSTGKGVALVATARARGVDVTCETCAHYLVLTQEDAEELGAAPSALRRCARDNIWKRSGGRSSRATSSSSPLTTRPPRRR
jgi:allantoinase